MRRSNWRKLRADWRDTMLLVRQFKLPLFWFSLMILGSGSLYYFLSQPTADPLSSLSESVYHTLTLTFLQPTRPFPREVYLQIFYFLLPILGVGILAQGLADFGVSLFNRRARSKEWQMAVASTYRNHMVLVGLGHLGYRVVRNLHEMNQEIVVVEQKPKPDLVDQVQSMGITVITDDATREFVLEAAGVRKAHTILLCTQNDSLNLEIAVKARNLNPNIQVVIRIFDDDFARSLQKQFGFKALSATGMAAPVFASTAANVDITPPITINGQPNSLARFEVNLRSRLANKTVSEIEEEYDISMVFLQHDGKSDLHPNGGKVVCPGDSVAILGGPEQINHIVQDN